MILGLPVLLHGVPEIITLVGTAWAYDDDAIVIPAGRQAGDICILFNFALDLSTETPPSSVTPSGFTSFGTSHTSNAGANAARFNKWWKQLDGFETSISGMPEDLDSEAFFLVWVFRKKLGTWATPVMSGEYLHTQTDASSDQTISSGTAPRACFSATFNGGAPSMAPGAGGSFETSPSTGGKGLWLIQNGPSAPAVVCTPGGGQGFASGYVGVTL